MLEALNVSRALPHEPDSWLHGADVAFDSVGIDSRNVVPGQLFVAISGERFDGHAFVPQAVAAGAVAVMVERVLDACPVPQWVVKDTRTALGRLAALHRNLFAGRVAAVTGSSGKTTVKEMLASILRADHGSTEAVLATHGNLNNDLGAPLTLLALNPAHRSAVIELGANHVGEISYTVALTRPQVAIITNAGTAHVGEFGGPERIVKAKGEILEGLPATGIAVLNRDDAAFEAWQEKAQGRRVLSFALDHSADISASHLHVDARGCYAFTLQTPAGVVPRIQLNVLGRHNVANALAAAAAAVALGVSCAAIQAGLEAVQPVKGRVVAHIGVSGMCVIDDSYNANPAAMRAAVDILASFPMRTLLVLGDMGELGAWAESEHAGVGRYAQGRVDALYAVGSLMRHAVEAFGAGGQHFSSQEALIAALLHTQAPDTTLLIKGSRSAAMERVVAALLPSTGEH